VIRTFRSKALAELWSTSRTGKIDLKLHKRVLLRLDRLNVVTAADQMNLPGFNFHALKGSVPTRYTVHVNGPWCITFEFDSVSGDALRVDFEQYH
jgi:toxin HigB-1